ncbi:MAG: hypothetical protein ISR51_00590 [Rhodospirillales bacterium]|nr:hypothetical protein [Alphaproteobacteria bacterium]MBL6947148.1 hypothetical protein [Rhodospirillales bacterium]
MKILLATLVIFVGLLGFPAAGWSEGGARISDFERYKSSPKTIPLTEYRILMTRLIGTYEGIGWINALNDQEGRPPVFCPPPDFKITVKYLRGMLDEEIRIHTFSKKPYPPNSPMDAIVMFAARARFPCK